MSFYNMPAGCFGPSDIDHLYALGYREERCCETCQQYPCECCQDCGASPQQACEPDCGLNVALAENPSPDMLDYWQSWSEHFEPVAKEK